MIEELVKEQLLDRSIISKLEKWGYSVDLEIANSKLVIKNRKARIHMGYNPEKQVYFMSVSAKKRSLDYKFFEGIEGQCYVKSFPTKIEIIHGKKEWHIGFNNKKSLYYSFSSRYSDVVNNLISCAKKYA